MLSQFIIEGGKKLEGEIIISGAKNAALPILASTLLTSSTVVLSNVPKLSDVEFMCELLGTLGAQIEQGKNVCSITVQEIKSCEAPYDIVRKMRASILVLGPLLARFGKAHVSLPGGCAIGNRPIDFHLNALTQMGARIEVVSGYINAQVKGVLKGCDVDFPFPTVTGTENIMMAAVLAKGRTVIKNAAKEPEVVDLAECLNKMGAKIQGPGTSTIIIDGVEGLSGTSHTIIPDRLETATYAFASLITQGRLVLKNTDRKWLDILSFLEGMHVEDKDGDVIVSGYIEKPVHIETQPYPGFATDLQAQLMALMLTVPGESTIHETIFENRFMHVPELCRMGGHIEVKERTAHIYGGHALIGAPVMATDLRASFSLILAALKAKGCSVIYRTYHLDRGYENIEGKLSGCGAFIQRVKQAA